MNANSYLTIRDNLKTSNGLLAAAGIGTAELDVLVLLEDLLHTNRAQLLAHPERELTAEQQKVLNSQITRRAKHEPLAYIRGKTEFYGREFIVNNNVLEPRPESETIIDMLKKLGLPAPKIADIGTGSGCLAITAKLEIPDLTVTAIDIDEYCLDVARQNAKKHNIAIKLLRNDLLENINESYDVLLCNLPYVPDEFKINKAAKFEPRLAIFGGKDGLDLYRKLFRQISATRKKPGYILTESLPTQHKLLAKIAKEYNYTLQKTEDFIQQFTLVVPLQA